MVNGSPSMMETLTPRQVRAAALLVTGRTARDVAREINCTPETISIWRRDPEFQHLVLQLKAEAMTVCRDMISAAALDAAHTLVGLVREGRSEEVRRRAALDVLNLSGIRDRSGILTPGTPAETELRKAEEIRLEDTRNWVLAQLRLYQQKNICQCSSPQTPVLLKASMASSPPD